MNGVYILPGGTLVDYVDGRYTLWNVRDADARLCRDYTYEDGWDYLGQIEGGELNLQLNHTLPHATYLGPREHVQALEGR